VKWRGIAYSTHDADTGFIRTSVAQMNEYYLDPEGDNAKQYTMCHGAFLWLALEGRSRPSLTRPLCSFKRQEMGHTFGLAHTVEDFNNPDLGNCLDYTKNFEFSKHPDVSNYETLLSMYGAVGGRKQRRLRGNYGPRNRRDHAIPGQFWEKVHHSVQRLASRLDNNAHEDGWKLLHRSKYGEDHEMELGDGYIVRVHMLLANNDD
jgi:hypothetical protein